MRNSVMLLAVMGVVVSGLGLASSAGAGVSYEFSFRSTDVLGNPLSGVANGNSFFFTVSSAYHACNPGTGAGCAVSDVLLISAHQLRSNSISVAFDNSFGLSVARADEWAGVDLGMMSPGYRPIVPGVTLGPGTLESFDGDVPPPDPRFLDAGTYNIGTIVWDTNGATSFFDVMAFFLNATDGTLAHFGGGNVVDITGTEVLGMGFINVIPEPATGVLLGLGLAGLTLAAHRR